MLAANWHSPDCPPRLKEISHARPVLYYRGNLLTRDEPFVAVMRTGGSTSYGRQAAAALTADLARSGITIASSMTLGTLVMEAPENSGSSWTVLHALDQNREARCVPGIILSSPQPVYQPNDSGRCQAGIQLYGHSGGA